MALACAELIAELGTGRITHRSVAQRARVPLGATTYYFTDRADLVAAGLAEIAAAAEAELDRWARGLRGSADVAGTLARLVRNYLGDRDRALVEYDLYLAAARDASLRPLAQRWLDGVIALLAPLLGAESAAEVVALLDGVMLQALVTGADVDAPRLRAMIGRLTG